MSQLRSLKHVVAVLVVLVASSSRADDATEEKVKELVTQFMMATKDKDVDKLMKLADVPWLADKEQIIQDRKELQTFVEQQLDHTDAAKVDLKILDVAPFSKTEEFTEDKAVAKIFDRVATKGYMVFVGSEKPLRYRYVVVRIRAEEIKIVGGIYQFKYLLRPNKIHDVAKGHLDKAEEFTLFSLDPVRLKSKPKDGFHGWEILGKTVVKNAEARNKLLTAFKAGIDENEGVNAACFNPRHGIRISREGKTVDLVICFECFGVAVFVDGKQVKEFLITDSAQQAFNKVLRDAGIPVATESEK